MMSIIVGMVSLDYTIPKNEKGGLHMNIVSPEIKTSICQIKAKWAKLSSEELKYFLDSLTRIACWAIFSCAFVKIVKYTYSDPAIQK